MASLGLAMIVAQAAISGAQQRETGEGAATRAPSDQPVDASLDDALSVDQERLADRFRRFEQIVLRLAELTASTDPHRAALLREAIVQSKQQDVGVQFEAVVKLLEDDQLALAIKNQKSLKAELHRLLELLLKENRAERLESEKRRLRRYLKEVNRLIKRQRGVKARTEGGEDPERLADSQSKIAQQAGNLADEIDEGEGGGKANTEKDGDAKSKSKDGDKREGKGDGKDPGKSQGKGKGEDGEQSKGQGKGEGKGEGKGKGGGQGQDSSQNQGPQGSDDAREQAKQQNNPIPERIRSAQQRMREAQQKLEDALRKAAIDDQEKALAELEQAKAALKEVLRQLREEERERMLTMLEARFRKMLKLQLEVYEGTLRLAKIPIDERGHDEEIASGRLSRSEALMVREADRAIRLLHEDGTSVAMPEAVEQLREDMQQVTVRLAQVLVNEMTQSIEEDIIAGLEETIAALQKALKDLEEGKTPPGNLQNGSPQDVALVDILAELKMIRSLQMRINRRTGRYVEMIDSGQAQRPELLKALDRLSERQERIHAAARDLYLGKNK